MKMDGILIIDKPARITSHDVVARVRRILKTRRVGHTGTLDPFATGVMVILIGKATRLAQFLDKDEKEYEATIRFGYETDTGDCTGERQGEGEKGRPGDRETGRLGEIEVVEVEAVLPLFRGQIEQVPPMYSAKKIGGKKLYEQARKGIEIEREAVKVRIDELEMIGRDEQNNEAEFVRIRVVCSAGTYIRTLAEDIGRAVGVGAHLAELRRTRAGRFELSKSRSLDELGQMEDPSAALLPVENAVSHLATFELSEDRTEKTRNGLSTRVFDAGFADGQPIAMRNESGELLAVGEYVEAESSVRPKVVLL